MSFTRLRSLVPVLLVASSLLAGCGPALIGAAAGSGGGGGGGPPLPSSPSPANGQTNVDVNFQNLTPPGTFSWTPSIDATDQTFRLAESVAELDTVAALENVALLPGVGVFVSSKIEFSTTYFWRVDSTISAALTPGPVWTFTTEAGSLGESEPNDTSAQADSLQEGLQIIGNTIGTPSEDWYAINLLAGRVYGATLAAYAGQQNIWLTSGAAPEFALVQPDGTTVHWLHRAVLEFSSIDPEYYAATQDLDFSSFSVPTSGIYFLRVRALSATSTDETLQAGGPYAIEVNQLFAGVQAEAEATDANLPAGKSNDEPANGEAVALSAVSGSPGTLRGVVSGFLGMESSAGQVRQGFDWFKVTLPQLNRVYELRVRITSSSMGLFQPDALGGVSDLSLNLFWQENFGVTGFETNDRDSLRSKDPVLSEIIRPTVDFQRTLFVGVVHDEDIFPAIAFVPPPLNYSQVGSPFILEVEVEEYSSGAGLITEAEATGGNSNSAATGAESITNGDAFLGNLFGGSQVDPNQDEIDWLVYSGSPGDLLTVQLWDNRNALGLSGDGTHQFELDLFDLTNPGAPIPIGFADGSGGQNDQNNPRLIARTILTSNAPLGIRVQQLTGSSTANGFNYVVRAERVLGGTFETEDNNSIANSNPMQVGEIVAGVLDGAVADLDVFSFPMAANEVIFYSCYAASQESNNLEPERTGWGSQAIPRLTIRSIVGLELATVTNNPPGGYASTCERLAIPLAAANGSFIAATAGTYFIEVQHRDSTNSPTNTYVLQMLRE